jgi:hypothetical protein
MIPGWILQINFPLFSAFAQSWRRLENARLRSGGGLSFSQMSGYEL